MSPPNRQSVSRRGFLAAMAAMSAAVGASALSARGASAAPLSAAAPGEPLGSTARAASPRASSSAHAAHTLGENRMLDQMTSGAAQDTAIRPFVINVPDADIDDLRRRIAATRWTDRETVYDQSQGVQLATIQKVASYWADDYDWRKVEARLNALPQFITEIDGVDIHFIHVKSRHENAMPLILTHGWPGSVIEHLKIIEPLTDPTEYGGTAEDAFHLVIPSLPGYGFSGKPTETGWNTKRIAAAWVELMSRLGYTRYVSQGGDWGTFVATEMARLAPAGLLGIHVNFPQAVPAELFANLRNGQPAPDGLTDAEKRAYGQLVIAATKRGYGAIQATRPQTLGNLLADSPVGLAAWLMDHDAQSYELMAGLFDGQPFGAITRDDLLDDISLYWLTNTGTSAARLYWEDQPGPVAANLPFPTAVTVFPGEYYLPPRSWVERAYPNLIYFHEAERGGHFAAWEEPQLFSEEMRAAFRPLR